MSLFGEKIKKILTEKNMTQKQLGEMINLEANSVNSMLARDNVGFDKMTKVANALGYDLDLKFVPLKDKIQMHISNKKTMPISVVAAGAGTSVKFTTDNAFEDEKFPSDVIPYNADCGIRINGESMSPDYPNGCIVWVKQTIEVKYGDEVIVVLNGCPYFKIYERDGLHSINPNFPTIKVYDDDKCSVFGKVVGFYVEDEEYDKEENFEITEIAARSQNRITTSTADFDW